MFRASDWKLDAPDWTGRLRVVAKGKDLTIKLEDKNSGINKYYHYYTLSRFCRFHNKWRHAHVPVMKFSLNVSNSEFKLKT